MYAKCVSSVRHVVNDLNPMVTDVNMDLWVFFKASLALSFQLEMKKKGQFSLLAGPFVQICFQLHPSLSLPLSSAHSNSYASLIYLSPTSSSLLLPLFLTLSLSKSVTVIHTLNPSHQPIIDASMPTSRTTASCYNFISYKEKKGEKLGEFFSWPMSFGLMTIWLGCRNKPQTAGDGISSVFSFSLKIIKNKEMRKTENQEFPA